MPALHKLLLSVALLVFTPSFSNTEGKDTVIKCYQCHSKYDADCKQLSVNSSIYYKPCEDSMHYAGVTPFCRKINQRILGWGGQEVTVRKCGWVRHDRECYRVRNWDHHETVCQCFTDGCNLAPTLPTSLALLLPVLLVHPWIN